MALGIHFPAETIHERVKYLTQQAGLHIDSAPPKITGLASMELEDITLSAVEKENAIPLVQIPKLENSVSILSLLRGNPGVNSRQSAEWYHRQ